MIIQDFKTNLEAHIEVLAKLEGQIRIDNTCIDNFKKCSKNGFWNDQF